jgi:acyl carrier protein
MTDTPWEQDFAELVTGVLPPAARTAPLDPGLDLRRAGLDSMASIELLVRLETAYAVRFPEEVLTAKTFATPGALWRVLETLRTDPTPAGPAAG